jgi:uncharacterized membrane protein
MLQSLISALSVVWPCFYPATWLEWATHGWWYWLVAGIFVLISLVLFFSDYFFMRDFRKKQPRKTFLRLLIKPSISLFVGVFWPPVLGVVLIVVIIVSVVLLCLKDGNQQEEATSS